jgi:hypothetical protein
VDIIDQFFKVGRIDRVVRHVRCNDLRGQAQHRTSAIRQSSHYKRVTW